MNELILKGDENIQQLLGKQICDEVNTRKMRFCICVKIETGSLYLNLLTKMLCFVDESYEDKFWDSSFAKQNWFSVQNNFDEFTLVSKLRKKLREERRNKVATKFTILTTRDCNANCYYCFEGSKKREYMSQDMALKVVSYITSLNSGEPIELAWFGGEPLLNSNMMTLICEKLRDARIEFYSTIISNGLLMTKELIYIAKNVWNLKGIQITIDGTAEEYKRIKNYNFASNDSYQQVMINIHELLNNKIPVYLRLNVTPYNGDDLIQLVDDLKYEFDDVDINVYATAIYERKAGEDCRRSFEDNKKLYDAKMAIQQKLFDCGLFKIPLQRTFKVFHCNPDAGREIVIMPNGNIGLCEHYLDNKFIGHIDLVEYDKTEMEKFKESYAYSKECEVCPIYPDCFRLKICDNCTEWCDENKVLSDMQDTQLQMLLEYRFYLNDKVSQK